MSKNNSLVYTVDEAAAVLGIGRNAAYNAIHNGHIPAIRIGRTIKVPKPALDALMATFHKQAETAQPEILRMPRSVKQFEHKVGLSIQLSVALNNKLVESAIAAGRTLPEEIRMRLIKSFEEK
jgi:excisionase family DNA binding protein